LAETEQEKKRRGAGDREKDPSCKEKIFQGDSPFSPSSIVKAVAHFGHLTLVSFWEDPPQPTQKKLNRTIIRRQASSRFIFRSFYSGVDPESIWIRGLFFSISFWNAASRNCL